MSGRRAKPAKVADYLDFVLNESPADAKRAWTDGIAEIDAASSAQFGKTFADLTAEQQVAIVTEAAKNERTPTTPLERFFGEAKGRTIQGYYTSEIGIHQELSTRATSSCRNSSGATIRNTCRKPRFGRVGSRWIGLGQVGVLLRAFVPSRHRVIVSRG